jgi:hypothetical protein
MRDTSTDTRWACSVDKLLPTPTPAHTNSTPGKYLNNNPDAAPTGVDAYMANGGGNYMAPLFATQGVSDLGPYYMDDGHWHGNQTDYTTSVVGNVSISWCVWCMVYGAWCIVYSAWCIVLTTFACANNRIKKVANAGKPFLAYIAPKACHMPFTPAPWHADHWDNSWPSTEPRDMPSWNCRCMIHTICNTRTHVHYT